MFLRRSFAVFPRQRRFIRMNERIPELFRQKLRMTSSIRMVRFLNSAWAGGSNGTPNGIRTRVARMKTWCPRPLDDRGLSLKCHIKYTINSVFQVRNQKLFDNFLIPGAFQPSDSGIAGGSVPRDRRIRRFSRFGRDGSSFSGFRFSPGVPDF